MSPAFTQLPLIDTQSFELSIKRRIHVGTDTIMFTMRTQRQFALKQLNILSSNQAESV